jgi:hypothetical protein
MEKSEEIDQEAYIAALKEVRKIETNHNQEPVELLQAYN